MAIDLCAVLTGSQVRSRLLEGDQISIGWVEQEIRASRSRFHFRRPGLWVLESIEGGGVIGMGGFRFYREPAEVQFVLAISPIFWHQGLGTEAAGALIRAGFGWGRLRRIVAEPAAPNPGAQRFLRRLGMRRVRPSGSGVARFVLRRPGSDEGEAGSDVLH